MNGCSQPFGRYVEVGLPRFRASISKLKAISAHYKILVVSYFEINRKPSSPKVFVKSLGNMIVW